MRTVDVIIETPKGIAEKYNYDKKTGFFKLKKILPAGMVFPFNFGFILHTIGEDGDPLDILVISEFKSFPGCMMQCYLAGAIVAEQTRNGKTFRNDRFIGIPQQSKYFEGIQSVEQLPANMLNEIEQFFINYNALENSVFKPLKRVNGEDAFNLIKW